MVKPGDTVGIAHSRDLYEGVGIVKALSYDKATVFIQLNVAIPIGDVYPMATPGPPALSTNELMCSFCAKPQAVARFLIAGPLCYICDECVDACREIIETKDTQDKAKQSEPAQIPTKKPTQSTRKGSRKGKVK